MNSEVYFKGIKTKIREELSKARSSVYLAVAWLTDDDLFEDLIELSSKGIGIQIILNDDEINSNSGLNLSEFYQNGGLIHYVDCEINLMHNKFCVIDKKTTINGSFNWTRKASSNLENITIFKDEDISRKFLEQFEELTESTFHSGEYKALGNNEILNLQRETNLNYDELINRAKKRKENKSYLMAIYDYRKAYELRPDDKSILFDLAYCQSEVNYDNASIENYLLYLETNPKSTAAFNNLGIAYESIKELDKAIKAYSSAIEIEEKPLYVKNRASAYAAYLPDSGTIYSEQRDKSISNFNFRRIEFLKEKGLKSIGDYERLLKIGKSENRIDIYKTIGGLYQKITEYGKSIEFYSKYIANSKEEDCDYAYYSRAWAYYRLDNLNQATYDVEKAIKISPYNTGYKDLLGYIKKEKRKFKNWWK